jgi:hypothetical protein
VYSPFYSPIAVASFQPIVDLLHSAGVAQKTPAGYWTFDVNAYLKLVAKQMRWDQIEGNATYPASKTMLVTTTDVRRSNSAAMYLALASYTANGNRVVSDKGEAVAVLPSMARLFLGQGYSESSTEAPFEDYLALGPGKTPMLLTYESLFLDRQMRNDGSITIRPGGGLPTRRQADEVPAGRAHLDRADDRRRNQPWRQRRRVPQVLSQPPSRGKGGAHLHGQVRRCGAKPLNTLSTLTGGNLIEAEGNNLAKAFREIRAYQ